MEIDDETKKGAKGESRGDIEQNHCVLRNAQNKGQNEPYITRQK
jgi:hypothetical protein